MKKFSIDASAMVESIKVPVFNLSSMEWAEFLFGKRIKVK